MTQVDKTLLSKAFNSSEVRTELANKKVDLSDKSIMMFAEDGSVRIDIDGDGIFDKTVTGLVDRKGRINTKRFDVENDRTSINVKASKASFEAAKKDVQKKNEEVRKAQARYNDTLEKAGYGSEDEVQKLEIEA
ncbi:hypothetical protein IKQ21_04375 [bacterium]|nr:hypothetical protein [bacterium]